MNKSYKELIQIKDFEGRLEYLKLKNIVGKITFGHSRYLNQIIYKTLLWREIRDKIIIRDNGCDLGLKGFEIHDVIYIHHINPITKEDIVHNNIKLYDINNLICTSFNTHNNIHYNNNKPKIKIKERCINDTCPWKM